MRDRPAIQLARSGRFVVEAWDGGYAIRDRIGTAGLRLEASAPDDELRIIGDAAWHRRGRALSIDPLVGGDTVRGVIPVGGGRILAGAGGGATAALYQAAEGTWWLVRRDDDLVVEPWALAGEALAVLGGRRVLVRAAGQLVVAEVGRPELRLGAIGPASVVLAARLILGARAIALVIADPDETIVAVRGLAGEVVHEIALPAARCAAIAEERGVAVVGCVGEVIAIDLRYGRVRARAPHAIAAVDLDADARFAAVQRRPGDEIEHLLLDELFARAAPEASAPVAALAPPVTAEVAPPPPVPPPPLVLPATWAALRPRPAVPRLDRAAADRVLEAMLDYVGALAFRGIAQAWDEGRLASDAGGLPFAREALGVVGVTHALAREQVVGATAPLAARARPPSTSCWSRTTARRRRWPSWRSSSSSIRSRPGCWSRSPRRPCGRGSRACSRSWSTIRRAR